MLERSILKINDIFWSFQGEGLRIGFPSIFLRLAGCSLKCPFCDTKDSWDTGRDMPINEIIAEIDKHRKKYPRSQVVITGGEPLEQDLSELVDALNKKNFFISIETNGLHFQELAIDWWTVSPKDAADYSIHEGLQKKIDEIKLIVNKNLTLDVIKRIRAIGEGVPIFLQPDGYDKDRYKHTFLLFQCCQEEGIKDIRPGIQLHKVYNVM
jgi:organic radical activating enzyme